MDAKPTDYWRKSYRVQAVRITPDNIREIAEHLDVDVRDDKVLDLPAPRLSSPKKGMGFIGDWVVVYSNDDFRFFPDKVFADQFRTHSEQLTSDDKYAKVHQLVMHALHIQAQASFHGDTDGMDLVAIETTKKILEEI
jgi:hypothetical protein